MSPRIATRPAAPAARPAATARRLPIAPLGTGLLAAVLLAAPGCRRAPGLDIRVTPPASAPGEPLRIEVRLAGSATADLEVTLADAGGAELARATGRAEGGTATLWIDPEPPRSAGDLRVSVRERSGAPGAAGGELRVPVDRERPVVHAALLDGFHPMERSPEGPFRWTSGCALAEVEDPGGAALAHVTYACGGEAERRAWLRVAAGDPVALTCGDGRARVLRFPVTRATWNQGSPFAPVEIVVDPPFRPAELSGADDARELGLRLFRILVTLDPAAA